MSGTPRLRGAQRRRVRRADGGSRSARRSTARWPRRGSMIVVPAPCWRSSMPARTTTVSSGALRGEPAPVDPSLGHPSRSDYLVAKHLEAKAEENASRSAAGRFPGEAAMISMSPGRCAEVPRSGSAWSAAVIATAERLKARPSPRSTCGIGAVSIRGSETPAARSVIVERSSCTSVDSRLCSA